MKKRRVHKVIKPDDVKYAESALWKCTNLITGYSTRINGVLASILRKYPDDYKLEFISHEGA